MKGIVLRRPEKRLGLVQTRRIEARYSRQLRSIANQIGKIVNGWFPPDSEFDLWDVAGLQDALLRYSQRVRPWAKATAARMSAEIASRERRNWSRHSMKLGKGMQREINNAPIGQTLQNFMNEQVELITSLPIEAGQRVHKLALENRSSGVRASELAKEIMKTGHVTESRAALIARTETTRVASALTMTRAVHVGSESYIWRTAGDSDVRPSHKKLNGKVFRWDDPPESDPGHHAHPGMIWNCRCYPEPIIPDF